MTLTVSSRQVVQIGDHLKKTNAVVQLLLTGGNVLTVAQLVDDGADTGGARISFYDLEGDTIVVGVDNIEAYILGAYAPENVPESQVVESGMSPMLDDALGVWQAAFMELRAACDESDDPKVKEAVANLERVELELDAGEDDDQAPATS